MLASEHNSLDCVQATSRCVQFASVLRSHIANLASGVAADAALMAERASNGYEVTDAELATPLVTAARLTEQIEQLRSMIAVVSEAGSPVVVDHLNSIVEALTAELAEAVTPMQNVRAAVSAVNSLRTATEERAQSLKSAASPPVQLRLVRVRSAPATALRKKHTSAQADTRGPPVVTCREEGGDDDDASAASQRAPWPGAKRVSHEELRGDGAKGLGKGKSEGGGRIWSLPGGVDGESGDGPVGMDLSSQLVAQAERALARGLSTRGAAARALQKQLGEVSALADVFASEVSRQASLVEVIESDLASAAAMTSSGVRSLSAARESKARSSAAALGFVCVALVTIVLIDLWVG